MSQDIIDLRSLRIAVLLGGDSGEREVSLASGTAVAEALESRGHRVTPIDPAEMTLSSVDWPKYDVAYIALHGRFGEDGQIQSLFDSWGVPYTGSGAEASRLAFSKSAAKERLIACGVPTPAYVLIHQADSIVDLKRAADTIRYPLVMKPDASGSSLGVSIVNGADELPAAAEACFAEGPFGLIETAIVGSEWTLGLIDERRLPLIRIHTDRPCYDFAAKYEDEGTEYLFDTDLPTALMQQIESVAAAAASAIGTRGIARADVRVDDAGPWVLEVNTIPGSTDHSLVPKAAAKVGISFADLCEQAVASALRDFTARRQNVKNTGNRPESPLLRHAG